MDRVVCPVLVGREREVTELEDALLAANRGEGQIVLLAGSSGLVLGGHQVGHDSA
jgi:hypothetical protein